MGKVRHLYPGGNTSQGFYSFYDFMIGPEVKRKLVLKGGPGVGKSTFMKRIGQSFVDLGKDVEYHWCSSDNDSLDGVVIGKQEICIVDGTAPHVVDPRFPGAVDEIINLGQYWNRHQIQENRAEVLTLTAQVSRCFERVYLRLREAAIAYAEWSSFLLEARDQVAVKRNILALAEDFVQGANFSPQGSRHLFAAAITPEGVTTTVDSLVDDSFALFGVKGSPGSGVKDLFQHTSRLLDLRNAHAEIFHNPLHPNDIDLIVLPEHKVVMLDLSTSIVDYAAKIHASKFKRWLDFDQFASETVLQGQQDLIESCQERLAQNIEKAVAYIQQAKGFHDQLETSYVPAMDFEAIDGLRSNLFEELFSEIS
ncbi:MAG TPA: PRK06851 family protein [Syntrophomonadaceae bacterium]|nr:PRK06851 family protein [Syntrophomonadaceae bacterium]